MDTRTVIWQNLVRLMNFKWGGENLNKLSRECGWSSANQAMTIKKQESYVNLKTLQTACDHFGIAPWQILHPDFDPADPPTMVLSKSEAEAYERLKSAISVLAKPA